MPDPVLCPGSAAPDVLDSLLLKKRKHPASGSKNPPLKKESKNPEIPSGFSYKTAPGLELRPPGSFKAPIEVSDDGWTIALSPGFGYDSSAPMWPDLETFLLPGPRKALEGQGTSAVSEGLCESAFDVMYPFLAPLSLPPFFL